MARQPTPEEIEQMLSENTHQQPQPEDPTGFSELVMVMTQAKQIMDAARTVGFTEEQAFLLCCRFMDKMFEVSILAMRGA